MMAFITACGQGVDNGTAAEGDTSPGQQETVAANEEPVTVRAGWVNVLQWTHWAEMPEYIEAGNLTVEMNEFKASNEVLVGLQSGSLDMGTIGFNHAAGALARGDVNFEFVAGLSSGGSRFVVHPDSGISDWEDVRGAHIGSARGSTQYMQMVTAMAAHGLDIDKDVEFTHLAGAPDMNLALQRGDVDAIMTWEAGGAEAIVSGIGVDAPGIQDTFYDDSFAISSGIVARKEFIEQHPGEVQAVIDAYHESWKAVTDDRDHWLETYEGYSGMEREVLEVAAENAFPEFGMDSDEVRFVAALLYEMDELEVDVTDRLLDLLNYDFIEQASGQSAGDLGRSDG